MFAAPLAAGIMRIETAGLKGWQWLFILEGIPSVILGIVMLVRGRGCTQGDTQGPGMLCSRALSGTLFQRKCSHIRMRHSSCVLFDIVEEMQHMRMHPLFPLS